MITYNHLVVRLFLLGALATILLLALVHPAQAQKAAGVVTTQTAAPQTPAVGQSLTFTITVTNNSVSQGIGVKDFLPPGVSLVSVTPSQGTCEAHNNADINKDVVGCAFGTIPSQASAEVEIVVTPMVSGDLENTASAAAETSPATASNTSTARVTVQPA